MNLWEGIASPAQNTPQAAMASPWDGIASPVQLSTSADEKNGLYSADPSQRSLIDKVNRQTQLAGRFGFEGLTGAATAIPAIVGNAPIAIGNGVADLYNMAGGNAQKMPYWNPVSDMSNVLDTIGMPKPESGGERVEGDVLRAVSGAKSTISGAQNAAPVTSAGQKLAATITDNPTLFTTGAATGAASSGAAREGGYSPAAQLAAGLVGGAVGGPAALAAAAAVKNFVQPLYQGGRNQIIANLLASKASDPVAAAQAITNAPTYIPGSVPIAGVASGDTGLMGLQRGVQNLPVAEQSFKDRAIQQTSAQNDVLNNVAGNPADMSKLIKARSDATTPLYDAAKQQPINSSAIQPVLDDLDKRIALAGPQNDSGKLLIALKNKIQAGLPNAQPQETGVLDASGNMITRPAGPTMQQPVIGTYRETRDALNLKGMQPGALGAEVRGNIQPANVALGNALESQSPDFAKAQALYKQGSTPINQLEAGQAIKGQIQSNTPIAGGQLPIVQPKLQQLMENGAVNVDGKEIPLSSLTPSQQQGLQSLQSDLNRNVQANGARVAATPISELTNLATQSPVNALLSHIPIVKGIAEAKNAQIQNQLVKVMLDNPETARLLMMGKTTQNQSLARMLLGGAEGGEYGMANSYAGGNR